MTYLIVWYNHDGIIRRLIGYIHITESQGNVTVIIISSPLLIIKPLTVGAAYIWVFIFY